MRKRGGVVLRINRREMNNEKKKKLTDLCLAGRWTEFLGELPLNQAEVFEFQTAGQIMTLRVIASQQSKKPGAERQYSVKGVDFEKMTAIVMANKKKDGNA